MNKFLTFTCLILLNIICIQAATIKGKVIDKESEEPLIGATIKVVGTNFGAITDKFGKYTIKNVPTGKYQMSASMIGYTVKFESVKITKDEEVEKENFKLKAEALIGQEVAVTASADKEDESTSRLDEKRSITISNIVSANSILVSPDITVANVVQRISGISIQRNENGDGQYAVVRGMDKRYNYTLVNGIKIPSPNDKQRYVPLDIFPSELLSRLEVYKALTPDMEADAIGGVVNLVMKDAPEIFTVKANASVGYNDIFLNKKFANFDKSIINNKSPQQLNGSLYKAQISDFNPKAAENFNQNANPNYTLGVSVGGRLLEDNSLGYLLAASFQNANLGSESYFFNAEVDRISNKPSVTSVAERFYSTNQQRSGLHSKFDFKPIEGQKIELFASYMNLYEAQVRNQTDTSLWRPNRKLGEGTISDIRRSRQTMQDIFTTALKGKHDIVPLLFNIDWTVSFATAVKNEPDMSTLDLATEALKDTNGNYINTPIRYDNYYRRWLQNDDTDKSAFLNFNFFPSQDLDIKIGGMTRLKSRSNYYNQYEIRSENPTSEFTDYSNFENTKFYVFNPGGSTQSPLNYNINEDVYAGYAMFKYKIENLQITAGGRYEQTSLNFKTQKQSVLEIDGGLDKITADSIDKANGVFGDNSYNDFLPSIHLKYMPDDKTNWRLSYFKSLSRPGFFEVIPYVINEEEYIENGNPNLKRVTANNIDFRFEYFPNNRDQILAGVFYKNIKDPIERSFIISNTNVILTTLNFGTATNYGFEFDYIQYYSLSKILNKETDNWGDIGLKFNYTYTNSDITTSKIIQFRVDSSSIQYVDPKLIASGQIKIGDLTQRLIDQIRPLQGQSSHIANFTLLYKYIPFGIDAQIGLVYTGKRIQTVSQFYENDEWESATTLVDLSIEKKFDFGLGIYLKARNLLDTPREVFIERPLLSQSGYPPFQTYDDKTLVRRDLYKRNFQLGIRYNF